MIGDELMAERNGILICRLRFATKESLKEIHRALRPGGVFGMIVRSLDS